MGDSSVQCANVTGNPETILCVLTKLAFLERTFRSPLDVECMQTVSKVQYAKSTGLGYTGLVKALQQCQASVRSILRLSLFWYGR